MPELDPIGIALKAVNEASAIINKVEKDLEKLDKQAAKSEKGMDRFSASLGKIGSQLKSAGLAMTVGLTVPLTLLGKEMISQVGSVEQFRISLDTMLGSAEAGAAALNELQQFAARTPFELPGVVEGATRLLAMNIEVDKLLPTLKSLGDVAAGTGQDLDRLVLNFGQVATQGKLTGRELRDFAILGVPLIDELATVMGVAKEEIQGMVSEGVVGFDDVEQAFTNMTSEGGKFFDLMEKQSQSLKGILSNIRDNFIRVSLSVLGLSTEAENFGDIIEGGVFDLLKDAANAVLEGMDDLVGVFNGLSPEVRTFTVLIGAVAALLGPVVFALGVFATAISALGSAAVPVIALLSAFGVGIAAIIAFKGDISDFFTSFSKSAEEIRDSKIFKESIEDPLIESVVNGTDTALRVLDDFDSKVLVRQQQLADGLSDIELPVFNVDESKESLDRLVNNTKKGLEDQAQSQRDSLEALKLYGDVTEQEYTEISQTITDNLATASEEQESFLTQYDELIERLQETGDISDTGAIQELFKRQRESSINELTTLETESIAIINSINAQMAEKGLERLERQVEIATNETNAVVAQAQEMFENRKTVAEALLNSESETAQARGEILLALATEEKEALVEQAVLAKINIVKEAVAQARALGGVYNASTGQILTGWKKWLFLMATGIVNGGKRILTVAGAFLDLLTTSFFIAVNAILGSFQTMLESAAEGFQALQDRDIAGIKAAVSKFVTAPFDEASDAVTEFAISAGTELDQLAGDMESISQNELEQLGLAFDIEDEIQKSLAQADLYTEGLEGVGSAGNTAAGGVDALGEAAGSAGEELFDLEKELEKLNESHSDFLEGTKELSEFILNELGKSIEEVETGVDLYEDLVDVIDDVTDNVEDLKEVHDSFIEDAEEGLENYEDNLKDINDEYDDLIENVSEAFADDAVKGFLSAQEDLKDLTKELKEAQEELNEAKSEGDQDGIDAANEQISSIEEQIKTAEDYVKQFDEITDATKDYSQSIADVDAEIAKLNEGGITTGEEAKLAELEQERLILIGKQKLATEELANIKDQLAQAEAEASLSELDFIAFQLGQELAAIEEKRQAEIKRLEDVKRVQEAIVAGTVADLDLEGLSADAVDLAQNAIENETNYQAALQRQLEILEEFKVQEGEIYAEGVEAIEAQQIGMEDFISASYDRIIEKAKELKAAAEAALVAQNAVAGGGGSGGFADGGFTGPGAVNEVAGLVHKGEWVAPQWMVRNFKPMFAAMERMRQNRTKGFQEGGFTSPPGNTVHQTIQNENIFNDEADIDVFTRKMAFQLRSQS